MADWASLVINNNIEKKKKENCKVLSLYISKIIGQSYDFWRQVVAIILSAKQVPNKFLFCLQSHAAASTVRTQRKPNYLNLLLRIFPNAFRILPFHEVSIQFPHVSWLNRWFEPGTCFSKAPESFRACKAIFSSSVSENREVYTPETSCMNWREPLFMHRGSC